MFGLAPLACPPVGPAKFRISSPRHAFGHVRGWRIQAQSTFARLSLLTQEPVLVHQTAPAVDRLALSTAGRGFLLTPQGRKLPSQPTHSNNFFVRPPRYQRAGHIAEIGTHPRNVKSRGQKFLLDRRQLPRS